MDIFVRGLAKHTSKKKAEDFFTPKLRAFGIESFNFERLNNRACALITILDIVRGELFLAAHPEGAGTLRLDGSKIHCKKSKSRPDKWTLKALEKEMLDSKIKGKAKDDDTMKPTPSKSFQGVSIECGIWEYADDDLIFVSHYENSSPVSLQFGTGLLAVVIQVTDEIKTCLKMPYSSIVSIISKDRGNGNATIAITLDRAPKIYGLQPTPFPTKLMELVRAGAKIPRREPNVRLPKIDATHEIMAGHCFVYQIKLSSQELHSIKSLKSRKSFVPPHISWAYRFKKATTTFREDMDNLLQLFRGKYSSLHFGIKFQAQRLAQNGYLPPLLVAQLLPTIADMSHQSDHKIVIRALQKLFDQIPYAGPDAEAYHFDQRHLEEALFAFANSLSCSTAEHDFALGLVSRHPHLVLIHRLRVTPTGTYLEGPDPEPRNRILREWSEHAYTSFLRITFEDEDGGSMRFDRNGTLEEIHKGRFQKLLNSKLEIAGQSFEFLGFSHSSLRDQTCWLMSPIEERGGKLLSARRLITTLGDFAEIRIPAKCAARIGQAFTDLNDSVRIAPEEILEIEDVISEQGRVFSDGCSTASLGIFRRIWKNNTPLTLKPTLYQIRLGGTS